MNKTIANIKFHETILKYKLFLLKRKGYFPSGKAAEIYLILKTCRMKIHEYQAKELLSHSGIPVDKGFLCYNIDEALKVYKLLPTKDVIIKAQVLIGGRGKAGGVKIVHSEEEYKDRVSEILNMSIKGFPVKKILVGEVVDIASEYYLSLAIDREAKSVLLMLSSEGGMDIEEVSRKTPEKIHRFLIDSAWGVTDFQARRAAFRLFENFSLVQQAADIIKQLYKLMKATDASLVEINPLVLTADSKLMAIDAKINFDDNALYRHPDITQLAEMNEEEKKEQEAKRKGFSYVHLTGDIGCMVNGAGLAMATMDMIELYGGKPANFLDIGGSSNSTKIVEAMKLLLADEQIKVVLVNIFGGITRCDDVARGLLDAFSMIRTDIPVIVRLTGTNEQEGRRILQDGPFTIAETMEQATRLAVERVNY